MYIILTYDVNKKRVSNVLKICRKYIAHVQNSVFEGEITEAKLNKLKNELQRAIDIEEDAVCIYRFKTAKDVGKEQIGHVLENTNIF